MTDEQARAIAEAEREAMESGMEAVRTQGKYEEKKGKIGKITKKKWYIIDPRSSKIISYWDGIGMVSSSRFLLKEPQLVERRAELRAHRAQPPDPGPG